MTGFSEIMQVEKAYRRVSVEGCEVVGEGANGKVYRVDRDNVVKVYKNADALEDIKHEREEWAKATVRCSSFWTRGLFPAYSQKSRTA